MISADLAQSLERGRGGRITGALAGVWGRIAAARVSRPLWFADGAVVIAVGGSTLGGSGKTPVAVACARALAERGVSVTLVGHAYAAEPARARTVLPDDSVEVVGDEALDAARALSGLPISVVVAPTRQQALDYGLALAAVAVLDGVAQCTPRPATLSLLAVDAEQAWGAGWCPPRGNLRAPREALLAACNRVVAVGPTHAPREPCELEWGRPVDSAIVTSHGVSAANVFLRWREVRRLRVGLCTMIARPDRVLSGLARHNIVPHAVVRLPDHASARALTSRSARRAVLDAAQNIDVWLCTSKCSTHLPAILGGAPVMAIDYTVTLSESLAIALRTGVDARKNDS